MKTQFVCEKCDKVYLTADKAKDCEATHGDLIEAHVMPGHSYCGGHINPEIIYAKFRNKKGEEIAACYRLVCIEDTDFESIKKRRNHDE